MQANQPRPVQAQGSEPNSDVVAGLASIQYYGRPLVEPKRVTREDRAAGRFGPLPGEVFPDEARFGSFN
ncbi:MAG: hypothetical protein ACAI38_10345 [Myxococcota bacterium]|nr:hypothetical protein [Myxococcota bacterium]